MSGAEPGASRLGEPWGATRPGSSRRRVVAIVAAMIVVALAAAYLAADLLLDPPAPVQCPAGAWFDGRPCST